MSAICGIINLGGQAVETADLELLAESSAARGLAGGTFWAGENAGFAHLAFPVTPESAHEAQPMLSDDGRLVLVADVRLDNRAELMRGLGLGPRRDGAVITDPDLVLHAYQRWGAACVGHLLGDFVFAVWDRTRRALFLARDPLGGFSLSWHQAAGRFVFASETGAILDLPGVSPEINEETLIRTLAGLPATWEDTFFRAVRYLPPAHCLNLSAAGMRTWRYWTIDPGHRIRYRNEDEYVDHFLALFEDAVACRLRTDQPVALSLSGGYDSTLLAACAARLAPDIPLRHPRIKTFSYVFDRHPECDERRYIDALVKACDLDATHIPADDLWTFRHLEGQPVARDFLWTNCFVNLPVAVAGAARDAGCRILLDGHYGDTLCHGSSAVAADLLAAGRYRELARFVGDLSAGELREELVDRGLRLLLPDRLKALYRRFRPHRRMANPGGFPDALMAAALALKNARLPDAECAPVTGGRRPRCRSLFNPLWPNGMAAVRGALYGAFGLEKISPYFDRRLVEFILAIPQAQISQPGQYRRLQRRALERVAPPLVYERTGKTTYEPLLREGLVTRRTPGLEALMRTPLAVDQGWIDARWLSGVAGAGSPSESELYALSQFLHLELWLRAVAGPRTGTPHWTLPCYPGRGDDASPEPFQWPG